MFSHWARDFIRIALVDSAVKWVPGGDNLVKGVQCYELFGGIALKIHAFSFFFFYAGKIAQFSFTYEKVNKTDSVQPYGCNGPLVYINFRSVCLFVCYCRSPLPALTNEVAKESS